MGCHHHRGALLALRGAGETLGSPSSPTKNRDLALLSKVAQLPLSLKDKAWHHICVAWTTRDGKWSAYQDGEQRGAGENLASWHAIRPQGVVILGQEQVCMYQLDTQSCQLALL